MSRGLLERLLENCEHGPVVEGQNGLIGYCNIKCLTHHLYL